MDILIFCAVQDHTCLCLSQPDLSNLCVNLAGQQVLGINPLNSLIPQRNSPIAGYELQEGFLVTQRASSQHYKHITRQVIPANKAS